ncbi:D-aminoacyl-tRNA deacylase [Wukongibacter baidiensis]|uniref:D-aminoacyl-tRNA deacylase n=1 Tax=Wukongibacter baidiensis TaxID=1723361 RepID=UPI003D7FA9FA
MYKIKKAVYYLCPDSEKDQVSPGVLSITDKLFNVEKIDIEIDGYPVMQYITPKGDIIYYVRTNEVICVDYSRYLPVMNKYFGDCDIAGMVNWHGGNKAPDRVLCIHTTGNVSTGHFGTSSPIYSTNIARSMDRHRRQLRLDDFRVTTEATHWSGIVYGGEQEWIEEYPVPLLDIEIGSTLESWTNLTAAEVIAKSLVEVFDNDKRYPTVLYVGGIHFEETITQAVLHSTHPVSLTHILPSRWVEHEGYLDKAGVKAFDKCVHSIEGGIDAIVFHEKLKRPYRELCILYGEKLGVPAFKRKALKSPEKTLIANLWTV